MIRVCKVVALVLGLGAASLSGGCEEDRQTAVLLIIDYSDVDVGPVDQFVIQAYPADRFDDIGVQEVPETAGAPLTGDTVSVLLVLPERWADRNMIVSVVAMLGGEGMGQGSEIRAFDKGEVTELEIQLVPGAPYCGNGILEALEQCDASVFRGNTCQNTMGLRDGSVSCTGDCLLDVSGCYECGNSAIEAAEECDSDDFGGVTCSDYYFDGGSLRCDPNSCTIVLDECIGGCGNDLAEPGEACDGVDFGSQTCETVAGLAEGQLGCTPLCQLDISGCHDCGNGAQEADEPCDGVAFGGLSCADFGFSGGSLTCTTGCVIDTTSCCGDGVRGPGEVCDGTDFGGQTCWTVAGHTAGVLGCTPECELDVSDCLTCGNGAIEGTEECDGNEIGGMTCALLGFTSGTVVCSTGCTFDVSGCDDVCGNGNIAPDEDCDDGNLTSGDGCQSDCTVQSGWICVGEPSLCGPDTCGVGGIDAGEVCDGANLDGENCFTQGYRPNGGMLSCNAVCTAFDTTTCTGGIIDSTAQLQAAVDEAYATGTHQEIAIRDSFTLTDSIEFNECSGLCVGGQPYGVTIRPFSGLPVCFEPMVSTPVFDVVTGNNTFADLCFTETVTAMYFRPGADAGGNMVIRNRFDNTTTVPAVLIDVRSSGNEILANRLHYRFAAQRGAAGISVLAPANKIAMNLVIGPFTWAISMNFGGATAPSFIDHNSVRITEGLGGGGVFLNNAGLYCYRNNIVYGDGTSTGLSIGGGTVFDNATNCGGGVRALNNLNIHQLIPCSGVVGCGLYCAGSVVLVDLCDLVTDPGWTVPSDTHLCLPPGALVDGALSTGQSYEFNDGTVSPDYLGAAPDVGARESGTSRNYGGIASSCP